MSNLKKVPAIDLPQERPADQRPRPAWTSESILTHVPIIDTCSDQ